jgi:signal transduction histidine kinase
MSTSKMTTDKPEERRIVALPPLAGRATGIWTFSADRLELAAYVATGVGYLMGVLTASHLRLPGFLLLTLCNFGWLVLFQRLINSEDDTREQFLLVLGMCVLAIAVAWGVVIGVGYDWLLPVVTVSIVAMAHSWRLALPLTVVLYATTVVPLYPAEGPLRISNAISNQIQLATAFVFVYLFSVVMRQQQAQRLRAEALVAEVEAAHAQLRAYADQVEELTVTRERNHIAREIHDTLGHYLTLLTVQLETALKLEERQDSGLHAELVEARRVAAECLSEVRRSVAALRPVDPTGSSFRDALARLVAEFQMAAPEADVALDIEGEPQSLAPERRVALYRCAQEALTNIRKHASATKVLVRLRVEECAAELTVLDNGVGANSAADGHSAGFGLLGIRERIELLGGTAHAGPEPGRGWRVEARVPNAR